MALNLWHERVTSVIEALPARAYLRCVRESGIETAVQRLKRDDLPIISIWIDEAMSLTDVSWRLSEAVTAGLGASLFRESLPYHQGLKILADYQRVVGPIAIVVGWYSQCNGFVNELVGNIGDASSILIVDDVSSVGATPPGFDMVDGNFLKMNLLEAISEGRGIVSDEEVRKLFEVTDGNFAAYKRQLVGRLEGKEPVYLGGNGLTWSQGVEIGGLLEALLVRSKWDDAFELACRHIPERIAEFIDEAGGFYAERGAYEYLWAHLSALPPDVKRIEKVAYWIAIAGLATNRQGPVSRLSEDLLRETDAPELRAATAVVTPTDSMLSETSRAVELLKSTATLRAHGFALAWAGKRNEAMDALREALRIAERDGAHHLVVACGIDIAEVELRQGNYKSGAEWSSWALEQYQRRGLQEQLRFYSATATLGFCRLLLGDFEGAKQALDELQVSEEYYEVPGYEAVVSTKADLDFLQGRLDQALELYERNHSRAPIEAHCFTALDILSVHVARRHWDNAARTAEKGYAISRSSTQYEGALGDLLIGIAYSEAKPGMAEQHLISAVEGLSCTTSEVHLAQAAIWLAIARLNLGRRKDAVLALRYGTAGLVELGEPGWRLLGANHDRLSEVRALWAQTEFDFELSLLGKRLLKSNSDETELGLRGAELLAALAAHPNGIAGERLHMLIYGDTAFKSTLKANISKLRSLIPIGSNPYRLEATFRADFIRVIELVSAGELQRALNMYHGPLLPESDAPFIQEWRDHIDEVLRNAIMESDDADLLIQYGTLLDDDLEVWERAREVMTLADYRRPVVNARIRRIRASWQSE